MTPAGGCASIPSEPAPSPSLFQPDADDAVSDAVFGPTGQMAFAQVAASCDSMLVESQNLCLVSNLGGPVDPAAFHAAAGEFTAAQAALSSASRDAPAGYPAVLPLVNESDWCIRMVA